MKLQRLAKRGRVRPLEQAAALVAIGLAGTGCLPPDNRPEPGSIHVTAEPTEATAEGFTTADGWTVRLDRFVTALGDIHLHNAPGQENGRFSEGSCTDYADTHYDRLFDFTVAGREKVGLVFGLGTCSVEYSFRPPSYDSVLGPGVTQQDLILMRIQASDGYAEQQRAAVAVQGRALRDGITKRFDWIFRHRYEIDECPDESGEGWISVVDLHGGDALTLRIEVRGEELFRAAPIDASALRFDAFAGADADGDDAITLEELGAVEAPAGSIPDDLDLPAGWGAGGTAPSLSDVVYMLLLPRITRLSGGGACRANLDSPWR